MTHESMDASTGFDDAVRSGLDNPWQLEFLYRQDPRRFTTLLPALVDASPGSLLLRAWQARLSFEKTPSGPPARFQPMDVALIVGLALLAGTFAKMPELLGLPESYTVRNAGFFVFPALAAFFLLKNRLASRRIAGIALPMAAAFAYINLLPDSEGSDTILLAFLHLPFLLWVLTGLAYAGGDTRDLSARIDYLRFNGEMLAHTALIAVCGGALTAVTFGLFAAIGIDIEDLYMPWVGVYGAAGAPIVAAAITRHRSGARIAPLLARIFGPLALLTLAVYLVTMLALRKSPYTDRDFLLIFNVALIGVLAIVTLSIAERPAGNRRYATDYVNAVMAAIGLSLDLVALSAILFRLASYGFTPNRIAVLGANLLIFVHLAGVLRYYVSFLRAKSPVEAVDQWTAHFLIAYTLWAAFITFLFPLIYRFA